MNPIIKVVLIKQIFFRLEIVDVWRKQTPKNPNMLYIFALIVVIRFLQKESYNELVTNQIFFSLRNQIYLKKSRKPKIFLFALSIVIILFCTSCSSMRNVWKTRKPRILYLHFL